MTFKKHEQTSSLVHYHLKIHHQYEPGHIPRKEKDRMQNNSLLPHSANEQANKISILKCYYMPFKAVGGSLVKYPLYVLSALKKIQLSLHFTGLRILI